MAKDNAVLRVEVIDDMARVETFGVEANLCGIDTPCELPVDKLPRWLQRRLAVLAVMPSTPPTHYVDNIGRRIQENVFWVHYTGEETDGNDTGEASKAANS